MSKPNPPLQNGPHDPKTGRFLPGNAGGPGAPARPHGARLAKAILERDIDDAVETLRQIMSNTNERSADRIAAVDRLLSYGCGKPVQADFMEMLESLKNVITRLDNNKDGN